MHIPDGFLSPATCAACYAAAAPGWYLAWKKVKASLEATTAAHIGLAACFVFLVQMINVPIFGGTTGHAVGTALVAIALGWAPGVLAASMALALQALVFGDGGLLAYGANVITMAIVPATVAAGLWALCARFTLNSRRGLAIVAFAAGYLSVVIGGLLTGLLLGLQPVLFRDSAGVPQYFPLGLGISVPAMVISHLLVGLVEGGITAGALLAISRMPEFRLRSAASTPPAPLRRRTVVLAVAALVALVPLGVLLPTWANSGDPWGEWSPEETAQMAGHAAVPSGMGKLADKYTAPVPDYQFAESRTLAGESSQYVLAALIGVAVITAMCIPLSRLQQRRNHR